MSTPESTPIKPIEEYLGDGVYARFDGFAVTLRTPRSTGDHWIVFEPRELEALKQFIARIEALP